MINREGDCLQVKGDLTMETVARLFGADLRPDAQGMLQVDLGQVKAADSAAVSLLLSWLRRAQRDGTTLRFSNIPDNLLSLSRLYGVAEMLPVERETTAQA